MDYNHQDLIAQRLSAGSYLCLRMVLGGLNDGFACKVLKEIIVLFEKKGHHKRKIPNRLLRRRKQASFFPRGKLCRVSLLQQGGGRLRAGDSLQRAHRGR
jgi:hypothetical protein